MGSGVWSSESFRSYSKCCNRIVDNDGSISGDYSAQEMFKSRCIDPVLNPKNVMRECCDSDEHPETIPVILALDVTGSMGSAAVEVAKKINIVMTDLYDKVKDVEFMIMAIGDLAYDDAPIQISQFESDIRIAEQLDKVYFEGHGGGNGFESYTAAWYMGSRHTKLDCHKRGKKGIIITMGDEPLNPYLPKSRLSNVTGDNNLQGDVETKDLYNEVIEKFDVYHLAVNDRATCYNIYENKIKSSYSEYFDDKHFFIVGLDNIAATIINIVTDHSNNNSNNVNNIASDGITW